MTATHLHAVVRRTLAESLGIDEDVIEPDLSLADDLAVDSLELLEVAMALEDTLGVTIPRRRMEHVRTCGQLLALVLSLRDRSAAVPAGDAWSGCRCAA